MLGKIEGRRRDDRGWDGWIASPTQWAWVWASFGSWWWTGKPGVLQSTGMQRAGHSWVTDLKRKRSRVLALSLTCKDIARHQPFADQEEGSHQEMNQLAPWSWTFKLPWLWERKVGCFSHSVVSNSLRAHGLQHARLPCPSPTPKACSNSCLLSQWCHPIISSSLVAFSRLQSFSTLGSFQMSQFFPSGGHKYWSFSFSISPSNEYSGLISFRMDWLDLLAVWGTLKSLLQHHSSKA